MSEKIDKPSIEKKIPLEPSAGTNGIFETISDNFIVDSIGRRRKPILELPPKDVQEYYPWLTFERGTKKNLTEIDLINDLIKYDPLRKRHVTVIFYFGIAGIGKTTLGYNIAKKLNCPVQVINGQKNMEAYMLLGSPSVEGKEVIWQDGPLSNIARYVSGESGKNRRAMLVFNEFNALPEESQIGTASMFDGQEKLTLAERNNEVIKVTGQLIAIVSGNPRFLGTNKLQEAIRDRASIYLNITMPNVDKESFVYQKICGLQEELATKFAELAHEWRESHYIQNNLSSSPSPRSIINFIELSKIWGIKTAFETSMVEKFSDTEEEKEKIKQMARAKRMNEWNIPKIRLDPNEEEETPKFDRPKPKTKSPLNELHEKVDDFYGKK